MSANLVIQAARFGDLLQTTRLIRTLEGRGDLHLLVDRGLAPLARILHPSATVHGVALSAAADAADAAEAAMPLLRDLRGIGFDAVFNCNFSACSAALCRIFPEDRVMGYRPSPGGVTRSPWMRQVFRMTERRRPTSLNLVDVWAHCAPDPVPPQAVNPPAAAGGRGLGVTLAGRESRRSLPMPVLAGLILTAFRVMGGPPVLLLGSASESPAARRLLRLLPPEVLRRTEDLSGRTDWAGLVDAVRGLDALITPDTGIMHLAAHLGVPVLAFFLSSAWCHETGPYGEGHLVWQADAPCAPCLEAAPCPRETVCLAPFAGDAMLRSLARALSAGSASAASASAGAPEGIRLWRSALDDLGTVFVTDGDPDAEARAALRDSLKIFLHLPPERPADAARTEIAARLSRDADWMLPPGRYC